MLTTFDAKQNFIHSNWALAKIFAGLCVLAFGTCRFIMPAYFKV
jgi:hypothetical protein